MTTTPTIDAVAQTVNSIDVGPNGDDQTQPKIVALDDGRFVVVYTDNSGAAPGDDPGQDILAQVYDVFGNPVGDIQQVNQNWFNDNESTFSVAALPGGRFVVVYEDEDGAGTSIRAEEVTVASDNTFSTVSRNILDDPGTDILSAPTVSVRSDGSYLVVYSNSVASTSTTALGKVVSSTGVVGSQISVLSGSGDTGAQYNSVATLTNGNYVTVHAFISGADRGIGMRILNGNGGGVLGATEVASTLTNGESDTQPAVAALAGGGFVVVWANNDTTDVDILFAIYDSAGNEITSGGVDSVGETQNNNEPTVIGLADGGFFVAYDDDTVADAIRGHRFDAAGNEVGAMVTIANTSDTESQPTLALTGDGRIIVSWRVVNGNNADVGMAIYDPRETTIDGDGDNNSINARLNDATLINGLGGDDTLYGRNGDDTLRGDDGNDQIYAGLGDDRAEGGAGNDIIRSGPGKDTLLGGSGDDTLGASNKADLLRGEDGSDLLLGSNGNDRLFGGANDDTLLGGNGRDTLLGEGGADRLVGGNQVDTASYSTASSGVQVRLWAGDGTAGDALGDVLIEIENLEGSDYNDTLSGDDGVNRIEGGAGNDVIQGLAGGDVIYGERGADTLTGGDDSDTFLYVFGDGADTITDFVAGAGSEDVIRLFGFGAGFDTLAELKAHATQVGGDTVIDFGGGDTITLQGVTLASLHADDFIFG